MPSLSSSTSRGSDKVSTVGQSMGGRIVLELARRGVGGDTVALDPGGFWTRSRARRLQRHVAALHRAGRGAACRAASTARQSGAREQLLLAQLSARPWALSAETVLPDVRGLAESPATGAAMDALTRGPKQQGPRPAPLPGRVTIGWGRRDLVTLPRQAARAVASFPGRGAALVRAVRTLPPVGRTGRGDPTHPRQHSLNQLRRSTSSLLADARWRPRRSSAAVRPTRRSA